MDRRSFFEYLAAMTSGLLIPGTSWSAEAGRSRDRLGERLPQRKLGRTGEQVTMLGLGGWHIGRMEEANAQATIEAALESGVRFFDSAEQYQDGRSERYLGRFLTPKYRDSVFLMTKTAANSGKQAEKDLEGSLKRLNTDQLDLWQIHAIMSSDDVDGRLEAGVLDVVKRAKESGKVRYIGFTGHRRNEAHLSMLEKTPPGTFDTCQLPINVADPSYESFLESVVPKLVDRGVGVLAMKTLANGGFFGGRDHGEHGDNPKLVPSRVSIREALHFVWSLPVSVIISGADKPEHVREKAKLAQTFDGMTKADRQRLIERAAELAGNQLEFYKA